jgi:hypothetical protein
MTSRTRRLTIACRDRVLAVVVLPAAAGVSESANEQERAG